MIRRQTFKMQTTGYHYRLWEWVKSSGGQTGVVLMIGFVSDHLAEYTIYPVSMPKNKILRKLKLWLIQFLYQLKLVK